MTKVDNEQITLGELEEQLKDGEFAVVVTKDKKGWFVGVISNNYIPEIDKEIIYKISRQGGVIKDLKKFLKALEKAKLGEVFKNQDVTMALTGFERVALIKQIKKVLKNEK